MPQHSGKADLLTGICVIYKYYGMANISYLWSQGVLKTSVPLLGKKVMNMGIQCNSMMSLWIYCG
jgi:hypothetical protein